MPEFIPLWFLFPKWKCHQLILSNFLNKTCSHQARKSVEHSDPPFKPFVVCKLKRLDIGNPHACDRRRYGTVCMIGLDPSLRLIVVPCCITPPGKKKSQSANTIAWLLKESETYTYIHTGELGAILTLIWA